MRTLHFLVAVVICFSSFAQELQLEGKVTVAAFGTNEETLPFWMYSNTNHSVGMNSNFSGTGEGKGVYNFESFSMEVGAAFFYRDELVDEFQRRDLYIKFQNNWLKATLGAKRQDVLLGGLSASNKNFLWSANARPIPGLIIEAPEPLKLSNTFAVDWGIGHYSSNDDRFVEDIRIHYKRLGLITTFNERHKLTLRIQHYAQWSGSSPVFGDLNSDFSAFVDVFFARKSSEIQVEGEILNAVGNHLGTYLFDYEFENNFGNFSIYHEHPFEDGSGTGFSNFPDGIWGVFFQPKKNKLIDAFLYEYIDTNDQSASQVSGFDNYFNNTVYPDGWTYDGNIIGLPLFIVDQAPIDANANIIISGNRVRAHHFGVSGSFMKFNWHLKSTLSKQLGTFSRPFSTELNTWFNYFSLGYNTEQYGVFTLAGGVDSNNMTDTIFGGMLSYSYTFN